MNLTLKYLAKVTKEECDSSIEYLSHHDTDKPAHQLVEEMLFVVGSRLEREGYIKTYDGEYEDSFLEMWQGEDEIQVILMDYRMDLGSIGFVLMW